MVCWDWNLSDVIRLLGSRRLHTIKFIYMRAIVSVLGRFACFDGQVIMSVWWLFPAASGVSRAIGCPISNCAAHVKCPPGKYTKTVGSASAQAECEDCAAGSFNASTSISSRDYCGNVEYLVLVDRRSDGSMVRKEGQLF